MTRKMSQKRQESLELNNLIRGGGVMEHRVDIPEKLFEIFKKKYGAGEGAKKVIDNIPYLIQPLNIQTDAWRPNTSLREEGWSVVTIGLYRKEWSQGRTTRLLVWDHIPGESSTQILYVWAGEKDFIPEERIVVHLGNEFDPTRPEADFVAELIKTVHELAKIVEPRRCV